MAKCFKKPILELLFLLLCMCAIVFINFLLSNNDISNVDSMETYNFSNRAASSAVTISYYDHTAYGSNTVAIKVSVDKYLAANVGIMASDLLDYFDKVLGLMGQKKDYNATNNDTIESITYKLDIGNTTSITLNNRKFEPFVVKYDYNVKGFLDEFVMGYSQELETGNITNTKKEFATIIKQGYHDSSGAIIKPFELEFGNKAKPLMDSAKLMFYISREWTPVGQYQQVVINTASYVVFDMLLGQDIPNINVLTVRANPIGYSILVIGVGLSVVIVLKFVTRKNSGNII